MSYCYDVMRRVFERHIASKIDPELGMEFSLLIEEMHTANHTLGDGINKDRAVSKQAARLDEVARTMGDST